MKKYLVIPAFALVLCAPDLGHAQTSVQQTRTAVERAAQAMGWQPAPAQQAAESVAATPAAEDRVVVLPASASDLAPVQGTATLAANANVPAAGSTGPNPFPDSWKPKLTKDGLPEGLVLNGPKSDAEYKALKRKRQKKRAAAAAKAAPVAPVVKEEVAAPAEAAPATETATPAETTPAVEAAPAEAAVQAPAVEVPPADAAAPAPVDLSAPVIEAPSPDTTEVPAPELTLEPAPAPESVPPAP